MCATVYLLTVNRRNLLNALPLNYLNNSGGTEGNKTPKRDIL